MKLNGRLPSIGLELSFQRDLLYTSALLPKKARGHTLHGIFILGEHPTIDMGDSLHHLPVIPYDVFYFTI